MKKIKFILTTTVIVLSTVLCCSVNALALTNGAMEVQSPDNVPGNTDTHNCPTKVFADLDVTAWYHPYTDYVLENDIMKGAQMGDEGVFLPDNKYSRAMFVTTLWRIIEKDAGYYDESEFVWDDANGIFPFEDVYDSYHSHGIMWAYQNGIINGVSKTNFAPNDSITREQLVTVMHRYAIFKGYDVELGENTNIRAYDDFESIPEYAISSMQWAVGIGLIKGKSETTLNPLDDVTRVEAAAIYHRFIELYK